MARQSVGGKMKAWHGDTRNVRGARVGGDSVCEPMDKPVHVPCGSADFGEQVGSKSL